MKNQIQSLLSREMTRKEFLSTVATGALLVVGGQLAQNAILNHPSKASTYGSSPYGGVKKDIFSSLKGKSS